MKIISEQSVGTPYNTSKIISSLISELDEPTFSSDLVIQQASPIISFGDFRNAEIATLGLNPSNKEIFNSHGDELSGIDRRFHTLNSLGIRTWGDVTLEQIKLIEITCIEYFSRNPYDQWFRPLDKLMSGTGRSFYSPMFPACHLDLVPYATFEKWGELSTQQKNALFSASLSCFPKILSSSKIKTLILNGQAVVNAVESLSNIQFSKKKQAQWSLSRGKSSIAGISYTGHISTIAGYKLHRPIKILGYNHNIQSSFGVTNAVKDSISKWVAKNWE